MTGIVGRSRVLQVLRLDRNPQTLHQSKLFESLVFKASVCRTLGGLVGNLGPKPPLKASGDRVP